MGLKIAAPYAGTLAQFFISLQTGGETVDNEKPGLRNLGHLIRRFSELSCIYCTFVTPTCGRCEPVTAPCWKAWLLLL